LLLATLAFGATFYSQTSGTFNDRNNWNSMADGSGVRPTNGDFQNTQNTFIVQVGDAMTIDSKVSSINLVVNGSVTFNTTNFNVSDSLIVNSGGTIDTNGNIIDLGNAVIIIDDNANYVQTNGGEIVGLGGVLPVEMLYFEISNFSNMVRLQWSTATEHENYGFYVFRKDEKDLDWDMIKFINGKGYSYNKLDYSYTDITEHWIGNRQYKLVQVDYDGKQKTYGPVKAEGTLVDKTYFEVYPNPTNGYVKLIYRNPTIYTYDGKISIYDMQGRYLIKQNIRVKPLQNITDVDVTKLSTGSYFVVIQYADITLTNTLTIIK